MNISDGLDERNHGEITLNNPDREDPDDFTFSSPVKKDGGQFGPTDPIMNMGASMDAVAMDVEDEKYPELHHPTPSNKFMAFLNILLPHGGAMSNISTLTAVALGSGVMAVPLSFQQSGIITSVIVNLAITASTIYSVYVLMVVVDKTGKKFTMYETLSRVLLGPGWDWLAAFNMFAFGFGSCVFFVISLGTLLLTATEDPSVNSFLRSDWGNRVMVIMIWVFIMLPLSIPKEINSVRYTSFLACVFITYLVAMVVVQAVMHGFKNGKPVHDVAMFKTGNGPIIGFSMVIFSYLCQINTFELYGEMIKPSPALLTRDTAIAMIYTVILYIICGVFAYYQFGEEMASYILLSYDLRDSAMIAVAYAVVGFSMCTIFPLVLQPARDSLYYILGLYFPMFKSVKTVPFWLHALICGTMSFVSLAMGLFIDKTNVWFSLVGSFCTAFLGFLFPALFYMYSGNWSLKTVGWFNYISTYLLLIGGIISLVFGCAAVIYLEIFPDAAG